MLKLSEQRSQRPSDTLKKQTSTYCKYMFMGYIETDVAMHMHTSLSPAVMLICLQQVAVMNSLTVNLHLLFVPWLSLAHNYATARAIWSDFDLNKSTSC